MGGQACVLYGAAEFSRDVDLNLLYDKKNFQKLQLALKELDADVVAIPPLDPKYLQEGLAIHFRCKHPDASGLRIDVMSIMRNIDTFEQLWNRRTTFKLLDEDIDVLSLSDLVNSKKTQRDKDWPMIRRLVEVNYFNNRKFPTDEQINFWFLELRSSELLFELSENYPETAHKLVKNRPLLALTVNDRLETKAITVAIRKEEDEERRRDVEYWQPLKKKLESLRHHRNNKNKKHSLF